ncbi:MAG: phosphate regulon sensor histidine kinase PhoR [Betaproteobacteria bacterium]|nr:phosphate regulon sensor histidine kinase PhoR [Betaproteobacteria bacterium]
MFWRLFNFVAIQLAGALFGGALADWLFGTKYMAAGGLIGALAAAAIWLSLDLARGERVLRWLQGGDVLGKSARFGLWGEVAARARKLIETREQEKDQARAQLKSFLAAIQASPNGVMILDPRNRIEWSNQTAAEQFGIDATRDKLQPIVNLIRDPAFIDYFHREEFDREVIINAKQQPASRPKRVSVQLHPYGEGSKLLITRDVTAIEQAEAMRRDFVANVSHEIRTPLTVLAGFVETMQDLPLDDAERQRYLGLMAAQSNRMQSLVADLLTLSQLEGSPPPGVDEAMAAPALMERLQSDIEALSKFVTGHAAPHSIVFSPAPQVELLGASNEIYSAFANLAQNAVRYTPPGESIAVSLMLLDNGRAVFAVTDGGPGIPAEHLPRLTERFYRVDKSRSRETGGTGLGLAIVKHVVQRHGGELKIDSAVGHGSTFSITLPAHRVRRVKG